MSTWNLYTLAGVGVSGSTPLVNIDASIKLPGIGVSLSTGKLVDLSSDDRGGALRNKVHPLSLVEVETRSVSSLSSGRLENALVQGTVRATAAPLVNLATGALGSVLGGLSRAIPTSLSGFVGFSPIEWSGGSQDPEELIYLKTNIDGYFFDAYLHIEHSSGLMITEHPVQTGANITDHAYQLPSRLMMEIGMSDAMGSMVAGQWDGGETKSVTAFQVLKNLQKSRKPFTVVTRLETYENMLIENILVPDDYRTTFGLRATVMFRQIIMAKVSTKTVDSSKPQTTDTTNKGNQQTTPSEANGTDVNNNTTNIENSTKSSTQAAEENASDKSAQDSVQQQVQSTPEFSAQQGTTANGVTTNEEQDNAMYYSPPVL